MSKKVTKMNQEAENQQMEAPDQEAEVVETKEGIKKKAARFGKKILPYALGAVGAIGCCVLVKAIGSKNAEKVIDNISNALPDHGSDYTGFSDEENKTE